MGSRRDFVFRLDGSRIGFASWNSVGFDIITSSRATVTPCDGDGARSPERGSTLTTGLPTKTRWLLSFAGETIAKEKSSVDKGLWQ